jgi:hypothetical protein
MPNIYVVVLHAIIFETRDIRKVSKLLQLLMLSTLGEEQY